MQNKIKQIVGEYGPIAIVVYFAIFFTVLLAAWGALHFGWRPESVAGNVGTFTAAYLATKLTQPARIAATLVLTPILARVHRRLARKPTP